MSTPPTTPSPPGATPKSRWGRMGGVMRRASTVLTIANSRPGTPSLEKDSDTASLNRTSSRTDLNAAGQQSQSQPRRSNSSSNLVLPADTPSLRGVPTPIAESPAREEQAAREQVVGPSPLAQPQQPAASEPQAPAAAEDKPASGASDLPAGITVETKPEDSAQPNESIPSPTGYIPPPTIDSTAGNPGAFTDDPEALPQPVAVVDPYAADAAKSKENLAVVDGAKEVQQEVVLEAAEKQVQEPAEEAKAESTNEVYPEQVDNTFKTQILPMEPSASYFDKPLVESLLDFEVDSPQVHVATPEFVEAVAVNSTLEPAQTVSEEPEHTAELGKVLEPEFRTQVETLPASIILAHPDTRAETETQASPEHIEEIHVQAEDVNTQVDVVHTSSEEVHTQVESQTEQQPDGEAASYYRGDVQGMPIAEPHIQDVYSIHDQHVSPEHLGQREQDIWGGYGQSAQNGHTEQKEEPTLYSSVMPIPIPAVTHAQEQDDSAMSSVSMPNPHPEPEVNEDPFADPHTPLIAVHSEVSEPHPQMPQPSHEQAQGPIVVMPLPAFHEVIPSGSIHRVPSQASSFGISKVPELPIDERSPLLPNKKQNGNGVTGIHTHGHASYVATPANHSSISPLVFGNTSSSPWNNLESHEPKLHEYGWLEYCLPDGTAYYVHPTRRLTTDADLRLERVLMGVEKWVEEKDGDAGGFDGDGLGGLSGGKAVNVGMEGWLKEVKSTAAKKKPAKGQTHPPMFFERFWVDHIHRTVVKDEEERKLGAGYAGRGLGYNSSKGKSSASRAKKASHVQEEDALDLEYRYWSFMEAYPAHSPLPARAKDDALDVLTWAWTDGLLPSHRSVPAPFTKAECQELLSLLKSFQRDNHHHHGRGLTQEDHGIETRVVARILLRVAHWRQTYFRPSKPLPQDVSHSRLPVAPYLQRRSRTFGGVLLEVVVSCLFLGIPYLFYQRAHPRLLSGMGVTSGGAGRFNFGMDPELGLLRTAAGAGSSLVVVGACTCLVAAIVLSGSVTFLNLPGLDGFARTASVVASLFAAASIAATALVVLRAKADAEDEWATRLGISSEGIVNTTTLTQSLPPVFLAYGIIAFVASVILFVFRAKQGQGGGEVFDEFARWTVMTVGGTIVGVVVIFWAVVLKSR